MSKLYNEVSAVFEKFERAGYTLVGIDEFDEHEVDVTLNYGADRLFGLIMEFIDDLVIVYGVDSADETLESFEIIRKRMSPAEATSDRLFKLYETFLLD